MGVERSDFWGPGDWRGMGMILLGIDVDIRVREELIREIIIIGEDFFRV